jgi:hypothetical protein
MKPLFADTYYFYALLNGADEAHQEVVAFAKRNVRPIVTTQWVLAELANGFAETALRQRTANFISILQKSADFRLVLTNREHWESGLRLYHDRPDKGWSLTDCISFVVMQREGLTTALTGDRHFVQAGFEAVFV